MSKKNGFKKARNLTITADFLEQRVSFSAAKGFAKQKWIHFCETMMAMGYTVQLYEARQTFSKYMTVICGAKRFKVRFSNHEPIKARELRGDCDFFVGKTHTGIRTTEHAIQAVKAFMAREAA